MSDTRRPIRDALAHAGTYLAVGPGVVFAFMALVVWLSDGSLDAGEAALVALGSYVVGAPPALLVGLAAWTLRRRRRRNYLLLATGVGAVVTSLYSVLILGLRSSEAERFLPYLIGFGLVGAVAALASAFVRSARDRFKGRASLNEVFD